MYTLIVNLGLRSLRAIIFDEKGSRVGKEWLPVRTSLNGDRVEQDPNEWWDLTTRVIRKIVDSTGLSKGIKYVSVTSPSSCLVTLNKSGRVAAPAIMVSDRRAEKQAAQIRNEAHLKSIFNDSNHLAEASFLWPKVLWLKQNRPDLMPEVGAFTNANDYLIYRLTGKLITDPLNAEKFYYSSVNHTYPEGLFQYSALPQGLLPEVSPAGTDLGPLLPDVASQVGLPRDTHVVLATYDAICAFWGSGVSRVGDACSVSGTSLSLRVLSKGPARKNGSGILSQHYGPHDVYIVGGSNNLEGGLLEWARDCFYGDSYSDRGDHLYALMQDEAKESSIGARGLIFVPYLIGERVPHWDSSARGVMFGLERFHRRSDFMRSIFESMGFMTLSITNAIESADVPVENIRMSGGLSRLPYACEIRAHITGKPVQLLREYETAALGAFMVIAKSVGWANSLEDLAQLVKIERTYQPDPQTHSRYEKLYELFDQVYRSLKPTYRYRMTLLTDLGMGEKQTVENL